MSTITQERPPCPPITEFEMNARLFEEDMHYDGGLLILKHKEYQAYCNEFAATIERVHKPIPHIPADDIDLRTGRMFVSNVPSQIGDSAKHVFWRAFPPWKWHHNTWKKTTMTMSRQGFIQGQVTFDGPTELLIVSTRQTVWMSLTPSEFLSQRPGIRRANGKVLVGGLGMGWFARRCLEKKTVSHVTVVDKDESILDYFGKPLVRDYGDRVKLVLGDAYKQRFSKFDAVLYDIWPGCGHSVMDERWEKITREHPNTWAW